MEHFSLFEGLKRECYTLECSMQNGFHAEFAMEDASPKADKSNVGQHKINGHLKVSHTFTVL